MEQLKNLLQFCRQHYEKLLFSFVLLLLATAIFYLYQASQDEKDKIRLIPIAFERKSGKPIPPVSLAGFEAAIKETTNPPALNLSGKHNLCNPVKWQQPRAGGPMVKVVTGSEVGVEAMQIVQVNPVYYTIAFDRAATSGAGEQTIVSGYHTVVTNGLAPLRARRATDPQRRRPVFLVLNETNQPSMILREVKGPPPAPEELVIELKDFNHELISLGPGKPYSRVIGYEAELKYPLTGKSYPALRKDSTLEVDGEFYKVVDITPNKVVLSDDSNGKRYSIEQKPAP